MPIPASVVERIERFSADLARYKHASYNETSVRQEFIDPLFEALGWDVGNRQGRPETAKDVRLEYSMKIGDSTKAPDYGFHIGDALKFFLEAKRPSVPLETGVGPAFQVRRYGWSARLPVSVLTDFEELAVYDCRVMPDKNDSAGTARLHFWRYDQYADAWDAIAGLLSRDAVAAGSVDRLLEKVPKGVATVDAAFLRLIEGWRAGLAEALAAHNPGLSPRDLNYAVQMTLDRIIFLRICEDRGIEPYKRLQEAADGPTIYPRLLRLFEAADERYNSGLFHFKAEKDHPEPPDTWTPTLHVPDEALRAIVGRLYFPDSPYEFSVMPVEILGQVYEQFLGQVIRVTPDRHALVEPKPEVRKAGGVYYTPTYIVDYIVRHTVGPLLAGKTPREVSALRILDPACGSGSFLIGAYQYLLDWHRAWYEADGPPKHKRELVEGPGGGWRLTNAERKRILLNNLYGVDIDPQAVEVTKLSLLLKVLEGESGAAPAVQTSFLRERVLPDLARNIQCGNSLIGPDFYDHTQLGLFDDEERYRINVFDWQAAFPAIMRAGGFDAVIGNPPYIDSEWMTKYLSSSRNYCVHRYHAASGNWDLFCVFIEKALQITKAGGLSSLIVPNKLGSTSYASGARSVLTRENSLISIRDYSHVPVFPVAVYPIVYVSRKSLPDSKSRVRYERMQVIDTGSTQVAQSYDLSYSNYFTEPTKPWPIFSDIQELSPVKRLAEKYPLLGSVAEVSGAATVAEAYELQSLISEAEVGQPKALRIINSGTIDRFHMLWGEKQCRYLGASYLRPVISPELVDRLPKKRKQQAEHPKIVVAGMTKCLECVADLEGHILAAKSTSVIVSSIDLQYLLGLLNSKLISFYYSSIFGGDSLQGGYLRIGPPQLKKIPIRTINFSDRADKQRHDDLVALVEQMLALHKRRAAARTPTDQTMLDRQIAATDAQIDRLVYALYGLTPAEIALVEGTA